MTYFRQAMWLWAKREMTGFHKQVRRLHSRSGDVGSCSPPDGAMCRWGAEDGQDADSRKIATFEELLRACLYEQEALRRVLVRKGVLTNEEV